MILDEAVSVEVLWLAVFQVVFESWQCVSAVLLSRIAISVGGGGAPTEWPRPALPAKASSHLPRLAPPPPPRSASMFVSHMVNG